VSVQLQTQEVATSSGQVIPRVSEESRELLAGSISTEEYFEKTHRKDAERALIELNRTTYQVAVASVVLGICSVLVFLIGTGVLLLYGQTSASVISFFSGIGMGSLLVVGFAMGNGLGSRQRRRVMFALVPRWRRRHVGSAD
jgi:hypothetical protein